MTLFLGQKSNVIWDYVGQQEQQQQQHTLVHQQQKVLFSINNYLTITLQLADNRQSKLAID